MAASNLALSEMLDDLRAEANISLTPGHNVGQRDAHIILLRRVQRELFVQNPWPRLVVERDIPLAAGQRLYEYPDDLDFDFIESAWVLNGGAWMKLAYGITPDLTDTASDQETFPPRRWENYIDNDDQFRLWPVPDVDGTIRFRGQKALAPLVEDDDKSTLDGTMVVLYAAAELLAQAKSELAQVKLQKAQAYFHRVRARQSGFKATPEVIGGGVQQRQRVVGLDYVPSNYGS